MNQESSERIINELKQQLPVDIIDLINKRDGVGQLLELLPNRWKPTDIVQLPGGKKTSACASWELIGRIYMAETRFYEAISIFNSLYQHMLRGQSENNYRAHKGMPLLWISDCFSALDFRLHSQRYLMLTLIEDALTAPDKVDPDGTGSYFRLVWYYGLPGLEFERYVRECKEYANQNPLESFYPEWLLQEIDQKWMTEFPTLIESSRYLVSRNYVKFLLDRLGDPSGKNLERLASYLLSAIPGFRSTTRRKSRSTDYDIVCTVEGEEVDFRAELGRYFVCECKDLKTPSDFSIIAKFCRVLDSTKSKFGILFSTKGLTGVGKGINGEREQMKVYQDRGLVIVVLDKKDITFLSNGGNLVTLLRERYEQVRLDLI